jgi:formylglycine-generating enzyme required for sulfatase activity
MDVTEVTQGDYMSVMRGSREDFSNPSEFPGDALPVENVSWEDAIAYCNALSIREGLEPCYSGTGYDTVCNREAGGYRLPTEAEWEYAARGGAAETNRYIYSGAGLPDTISLGDADRIGWYLGNSGIPDEDGVKEYRSHEVKTKEPNGLGIYDLSGNLWEWCWDWYGVYDIQRRDPANPAPDNSDEIPQKNPMGPELVPEERGRFRIIRGGAFTSPDANGNPAGVPIVNNLRVAYRGRSDPRRGHYTIGFRTVRKAP